MEKNPLASIIVPVYNVEPYIEACIRSIIGQDQPDIEIILVDDGSGDNCGAILDAFALTDSRITVIHKKNGGVSAARNSGLEIAKGEYILFVDGDDHVEPDYVSYLVGLAAEHNCDIAMNQAYFSVGGSKANTADRPRVITAEAAIEQIYLEKIFVAVWNKVYKRSFLTENGLRFDPDIWYGEGMLFNIACLQYTDRVAIGGKKIYHQVFNTNSAMRNFNLESNYCGIRSMELQKSIWKKKSRRIERAWKFHYNCFAISILSGLVRTGTEKEQEDVYRKCVYAMRRNMLLPLTVDIPLKRKLVCVAYAVCPGYMGRRGARRYASWSKSQEEAGREQT